MIDLKINNKQLDLKINLCNSFNHNNYYEDWIEEECEKAIKDIVDKDKKKYTLCDSSGNTISKIDFNLTKDGQPLTYQFFDSYSDEDLLYRRNRFTNSFLRISYFSEPSLLGANFIGQTVLYNKIYHSNYCSDIKDPNDENYIPINDGDISIENNISWSSYDKKIYDCEYQLYGSSGLCIFMDSKYDNIYAYYTFNNAANGIIYDLKPNGQDYNEFVLDKTSKCYYSTNEIVDGKNIIYNLELNE